MKEILIDGTITGAYASSDGYIIGVSGKKLNPRFIGSNMKRRYHCVDLCVRGKQYKGKLVHRLVWVAHNGDIPDGLELNHKDGDKTNNKLDNLELMTHIDNCKHAFDTGLRKPMVGENHPTNIITDEIALEIKNRIANGEQPLAISNTMDVSYYIVKDIKRGKTWKHIG
jgi:hypothetical protein